MNPRERTAVTPPTPDPSMSQEIAMTSIKMKMTSNQPARTFEKKSLRLMIVTDRKMNSPSIVSDSIMTVAKGFKLFRMPMGLVSMTSAEDHAQKASPRIRNTTVSIVVITVERIISSLSGTSSLTGVHSDLENRGFPFHS